MHLLLLLLLAVPALAQFRLSAVAGGAERLIEAVHDLGTIEAGDRIETRLRLRNAGAGTASVDTIGIAGSQFSLSGLPLLPAAIAPGGYLDFQVRFDPVSAGSFSAALTTPAGSVILRATAVAAPHLFLNEAGAHRQLFSGDLVQFPPVETGQSAEKRFLLLNPGGPRLPLPDIAVNGPAFAVSERPPENELGPGESVYLKVGFVSKTSGLFEGLLRIGRKEIVLRAEAIEPPVPSAELLLESAGLKSGTQDSVSVRLASPANSSIPGKLSMNLREGRNDPAMLFARSGASSISFGVNPGEQELRFDFQTGTTAGAIVFSLELGPHRYAIAAEVPPEPVTISSTRGTKSDEAVQLHIVGFDNTHSTQEIAFTFFDQQGRPIPPGTQRTHVYASFSNYFLESRTGGAFAMEARFPVSGNPQQIHSAVIEFVNPAGSASTQRIVF